MTGARGGAAGGFSLVEALVAMAVAGMVVLGTVGLTAFSRDVEDRLDRQASARDQIVAADAILRELVTVSVPELGGRGTTGPGATSERLTILTSGSPIMAFDRPTPVTLAVRGRADGTKALIVAWRDGHAGVEREETAIDGARAISLSYFGAEIGGSAVWRAGWDYPARLPLAVSVRVDHPILGPPIDLVARTFARYPQVCAALPHEPACRGREAASAAPAE